ncbi:hypothetical protein QYE76_016391 [Lolium multiflorum]|uniref:Integrase zinc-binding domain-containing protein n=1 Tax=Lolium multiflorum TaxID=4521 RepID=A0AAD8QLQ1_LOLMU|nr:hypothetical protein QYE76_016391 [Lolium multiflorum]
MPSLGRRVYRRLRGPQGALTGPVRRMPDFDRPFIVDSDASGRGSAPSFTRATGRSPTSAGRLLPPQACGRLSTVPQHQWISKLFGFDFTVEYRPGRLNTVADALSRRDADPDTAEGVSEGRLLCIRSGPSFALFDRVRQATASAPDAQLLRQQLDAGELDDPWRFVDGLLLHGRRVFVPDHDDLRHQVLLLAHSASHEGFQKTLHRLRADFYVPGDRAMVQDWVRSCETCQRNKTETLRPAGVLQPLDVPSQVWADISMDFIEGLSEEEATWEPREAFQQHYPDYQLRAVCAGGERCYDRAGLPLARPARLS